MNRVKSIKYFYFKHDFFILLFLIYCSYLKVSVFHSLKDFSLCIKLCTDPQCIHESPSFVTVNQAAKEDTVVLKIGSVAMAPQADNPLGRSVLRKDIYQ